jgi:hypothetical protein
VLELDAKKHKFYEERAVSLFHDKFMNKLNVDIYKPIKGNL